MASHPASVQHHPAFGWDMRAAECGCWQNGHLGDIWDVASPEEVCPCREQILWPTVYIWILARKGVGGMWGLAWVPFFSTTPSLFWSWQHIAAEEQRSWAMCMCSRASSTFCWDFFLGKPGVQGRKEPMGQCSHRMRVGLNVMHLSYHWFRTLLCPCKVRGRLSFFVSFWLSLSENILLVYKRWSQKCRLIIKGLSYQLKLHPGSIFAASIKKDSAVWQVVQ